MRIDDLYHLRRVRADADEGHPDAKTSRRLRVLPRFLHETGQLLLRHTTFRVSKWEVIFIGEAVILRPVTRSVSDEEKIARFGLPRETLCRFQTATEVFRKIT